MIGDGTTPTTLLLGALVVISGVLVLVGTLTLWLAFRTNRRDRRRAERQRVLGTVLFERLYEPDPAWEDWVAELSSRERRHLRELVTEYLRLIRGDEYERLRDLARALNMEQRAKRDLRKRRNRLRALTRLALLEADVDPELLERCASTPQQRAGAARVLLSSDDEDRASRATALLIGDGTRPLTGFGMDTLYRHSHGTAMAILGVGEQQAQHWDDRLLTQVLTVLRYANGRATGEQFGWIVDAFSHDSVHVRIAALGVLAQHGWRRAFRQAVDIDSLTSDPSERVRVGAYMVLAEWGDEDALEQLRRVVGGVQTDRERLGIVRARWLHPLGDELPLPPEYDPFEAWTAAEAKMRADRYRHWMVETWT